MQLNRCISVFVDSLVSNGLKNVVVSPGSRNFPLINAFTARPINLISVVDERSAGFIALGMAQALQEPVAVCCTSGTAALNYSPAIAEAYYAQLPLLVLTADRPPESIDNWEGQSIRQTNVFQNHTVASMQTPDDYSHVEPFQALATEAMELTSSQSGPVHVNIPFREPFYELEKVNLSTSKGIQKRRKEEPGSLIPQALIEEIRKNPKILWLNGAQAPAGTRVLCSSIPVFSDVIANTGENIANWDGIMLATTDLDSSYLPDLVITTGKYMVSKQLRLWLRKKTGLKHWHIGDQTEIPTPFLTEPVILNADIKSIQQLVDQEVTNTEYLDLWKALDSRFALGVRSLDWEDFNEFSALRKLNDKLPDACTIHLSNSMPVRYWGYLPKNNKRTVYCNRGTSGIDGCTSTAVGHALTTDKDVFLITGDLAFFYDINGLWLDELPTNLKIIVMNNFGGGIFRLIDGPSSHKATIPYQTTPHQRTAKLVCKDLGIEHYEVKNWTDFNDSLESFMNQKATSVFEIHTDSEQNTAFYHHFRTIKT